MQTTLLSLAIALIVALLAALLGPYFIDWNTHRATFEEQASQAVGLPVRVTGPMDVRLLPAPRLVLSGVEIGKPDDPQAVRAKALAIEFALTPLFSGKLRAVEMRLIGPEVKVSLAEDGRATFPTALGGVSTQTLSIDKLNIEDASVELSDAASGTHATLSKLWFNGEVRALPGPIRGEGAFVLNGGLYSYRVSTGRPEANGSRVRFSIDPSDRPVTADVDGQFTADGGAPRFEGQATLARRIVSGKGDKGVPDPWRVTARVKANAANALFEQVEFQYGPDDRALKLAGTAEAKFGRRPRLDVVLSARQLDADKLLVATSGANLPPRAALAAVLSAAGEIAPPPLPTQIGFGIDVVTLGGAALQNVRGDIELGGHAAILSGFEARGPGFTQLQASGQIQTDGDRLSFTGPVEVTSADPRIFGDWLEGRAIAALPSRSVRLRGDVTLGTGKIAIERMQAELDRKAFDGGFSYAKASAGERSRLDLTLRADELDLDALMQFAGSAKALADMERPDDVALSLALGRLRFAGVDAGKTDVKLALNAAGLNVERFSIGDLGGLSIDGEGRIDLKAQAPRGGLSFNLGMRDPAAFVALASRLSPGLGASFERAVAATAPAKLSGTIAVEPSGNAGASQANIAINGALGAAQLNLKTSLTGQWKDPGKADIALDASLDANDVNTLVTLAAAEKWISVPRQPGTYTLSLRGKRDGDMRIDTRIAAANLDARANGTIRPFTSDGKSAALNIAIGKADVMFNRKAIPVVLRTSLKTDAFRARLDNINATIAGTVLRGQLGLSFGDDVPVIDGELKTGAIDVGAFFAAATGLDAAKTANERWSASPFVLPALPALAGEVKVEAARAALLPSFTASKLQAMLRFSPTRIKAESIEADLLGGRGTAEVTLRRSADGIGMQGRVAIKGADAAQLLFSEGHASPLSGRATLDMQFEGGGLSPRAIVGSLNGSGMLTLEKARVASLDPGAFSTVTRSVDQGLPLDAQRVRGVVTRSLDAGSLAIASAEASLAMASGIVRIETFAASAEPVELAVTGSYNLLDARIDTRLALTGAAVAGAPMRPELVVALRGPASAPERTVDVSMLTGWLALRSVDRQTKRLEAIEQGRPAEAALQTQDDKAALDKEASGEPTLPELAPVLPRPRPAAPQQPHVAAPSQQPHVEPLPAPVEIRPAAGERRRVPQRVEGPPRANPFPQPLGNPFPQPLGSPPAADSPSLFR
ncbi:AsmA family protein [Pseudorhodoplanes sinuspersici]|uniref:AsmA family protein n=1 Tax=Pseudorhodoplanes sinuspersici TaxID=1235591 RepID=UPI000FF460BC|nr:AsmA family protein [Pseudorhodoplanes sinuspersici]RKE67708.1 large subunit ribosomal protein L24 [Pseudorhodoplanes sinuspersici]